MCKRYTLNVSDLEHSQKACIPIGLMVNETWNRNLNNLNAFWDEERNMETRSRSISKRRFRQYISVQTVEPLSTGQISTSGI